MPELPEVETIKRDLEKTILGKRIVKIIINNPKVIREPSPELFKKGIEGTIIRKIFRRAKLLVFELSNNRFLTIHLKMTGQLVYPGTGRTSRLSFVFKDADMLDFNDQRLFADLRLYSDWGRIKFIKTLGPEPFDLTFTDFKDMLSKRKTKIKGLLMEQSFVSGIGNIYASEILFRAKIDPQRSAQSLKEAEKENLFKQMKSVLKSAILHGGSSVDDYVRVSGKNGDYMRFHQVYGRANKPCLICGKPIKKFQQGGRGTYHCVKCQI